MAAQWVQTHGIYEGRWVDFGAPVPATPYIGDGVEYEPVMEQECPNCGQICYDGWNCPECGELLMG